MTPGVICSITDFFHGKYIEFCMEQSENLFSAIKEDKFEEAGKLLRCGANPNRLLLNGITPFHFAVGAHSTSAYGYVKLMLKFNGNPNVQDLNGLTPFHVAADWGRADCLNLLLKSGADISITDKDGKDVFAFAESDEYCMLILNEFTLGLNKEDDEPSCSNEAIDDTPRCNTSIINCIKVEETPAKLPLSDASSSTPEVLLNDDLSISYTHCNKSNTLNTDEEKNASKVGKNISYEENRNSLNIDISTYKHFLNPLSKHITPGLDATSPDNCFLFIKTDCNNLYQNKHINNTVTVDKSQDLCINTYQNLMQDIDEPNEQYSHKIDPLLLDTPKSIRHQSIDDEMAKQMLIDSKRQIIFDSNFNKQLLNRKPLETSEREISENEIESFHTTADTTVPNQTESDDDNITIISESDDDNINMLMSSPPNEDTICIKENSPSPESLNPSAQRISWNEQVIPLKLSISCISNSTNDSTIFYDWKSLVTDVSEIEVISDQSTVDFNESVEITKDISGMSDKKLRNELIKHGVHPGPINHARNLYNKKLQLLENGVKLKPTQNENKFSHELRSLLIGNPLPQSVVQDDESLRKQFDDPLLLSLRGGLVKDSFNYLLLDPRITKNLPSRVQTLSEYECLKAFVGAVFYIGKGKKSRPYAHLKKALEEKDLTNCSTKIQHIHDIWNSKCGVISLHVFQNVVASEAYTREAAMIEAIGLDHLTNKTRGKSYGECASWNKPRLRRYGSFLILSAMQILLLEGERQIRSNNIKANVKNKVF